MIPEGKTISSQELQEVFNRSDRIDRILNDILSKLGTRTMLDNPKIGTSFAAEFSSSALPWVTSSVAPATGSPTRFNFQKVSRFVIVSNLDATPANSMSIGFTRLGITTSNNKLVIPGGQTVTLELRVKEIYVQGEGGTPNFSILAGLTNVEAGSMGVLTGSGGTGWSGVG